MPPKRLSGAARIAVPIALSLALCSFAIAPAAAVTPNGRLQIIHLDVAQGDGAVIISPLGEVAMIDDGQYTTTAMGQTILQQIQALGVTHVKHHFNSHYHADHLTQFPTIFGTGGVALDYGWDRGGSYSSGAYTNYVTTLGARRRTIVRNQVIMLDSLSAHPVTIKCVNLNGAGISTSDENARSVVLKISYGEFDMVFGGDLTGSSPDIETTVGPQVGPVEAYKVHHHGSATSSLTNWLNATQPKIGVISVGNPNTYGHPTADALNRLHTANVKTYWTELGNGATPLAGWDKYANGQVIISATWEPGGVDTVRSNGVATPFVDTFTNSGTAGDVTAPAVAVTSPDGGEIWKAGSSHAITWSATDAVGVTSVDLAYSTDGGATFPNALASGIANSGSWSWTVPNTPTGTARVRVLARDAAGNLGRDSSAANFTIDRWTIVASAGAGGSITPGGTVYVVQGANQHFSIVPATGYHVLGLTVDGGAVTPDTTYTFSNVTAAHTINVTFSADQYPLAVSTVGEGTVTKSPDLESYPYGTSVQLGAVPVDGWAFAGWSGDTTSTADSVTVTINGSKTLTATFVDVALPAVTLTAPVGGETWTQGSLREITWSASDNVAVDSVDVDYSVTGPAGPCLPVARGLENTGSFYWLLPGQTSDSALVRVTAYDTALNGGSAVSAGLFQIGQATVGVWGDGPAVLALARPQPNPSRGTTLLHFSLPAAGYARLEVVDVSGRRMSDFEGEFPAGAQTWRWDGRGPDGSVSGAGLYFVRLVTPWGNRTERMARLR